MSSLTAEITATRAPGGADAGQPARAGAGVGQPASAGAGQPARAGAGVGQPASAGAGQPARAGAGVGQPAGAGAGAEAGRRWRWLAFGVVIAAAVMDLLDSTITQVAAPAIRRELGG